MKLGGAARADPASSGALSRATAESVCKNLEGVCENPNRHAALVWGPTPFIWLSFLLLPASPAGRVFLIHPAATFADKLIAPKFTVVNKNQSLIKMSERSVAIVITTRRLVPAVREANADR
jgi:hypothetical protein